MPIKIARIYDTGFPTIVTDPPYCREIKVFVGREKDNLIYDENVAMGLTTLLPNSKTVLHSHGFREYILVIDGKGVLVSEDFERSISRGYFIFIPQNIPHQIINESDSSLILLWVYTPSGGEKKIINAFYNLDKYY